MKKLATIISFFALFFFLTSCGPSACDCADLAIEALEGPEDADDLSERKQKRWIEEMEEKLDPCEDKANDDKDFDREIEDCFEDNLPADFEYVEYTSDLGDYASYFIVTPCDCADYAMGLFILWEERMEEIRDRSFTESGYEKYIEEVKEEVEELKQELEDKMEECEDLADEDEYFEEEYEECLEENMEELLEESKVPENMLFNYYDFFD